MILLYLSLMIALVAFYLPLRFNKTELFNPSALIYWSFMVPVIGGTIGYFILDVYVYSEYSILMTSIIIITMSLSYIAFYILGKQYDNVNIFNKLFQFMSLDIGKVYVNLRIKVLGMLLVVIYIGLLITLISLTGMDPVSSPLWFRIRASHDYGVLYALYQFIPIYLVSIGYYYKEIEKRTVSSKIIYYTIVLFVFITALLSGSRGMVVQVIFGIIILERMFLKRKLSIIKVMLLVLTLIPFFVGYQIFRLTDTFDIGSINSLDITDPSLWEFVLRWDALFNLSKVVNEYGNNNFSLVYGKSLLDALQIFVPRVIFPDKPIFFNIELHKYFSGAFSEGGIDFASGYMMAEAFLNLHLFGVCLYSAIWGLFVAALDKQYFKSANNRSVAYGFLLFYLPAMFYTTFPQDGFYGMFFQQMLIIYSFTSILLFLLKVEL